MKEYRLVRRPPITKLLASLQSPDYSTPVTLLVRNANNDIARPEKIKIVVISLSCDKAPDNLWIMQGWALQKTSGKLSKMWGCVTYRKGRCTSLITVQ